MPVPFRPSPLPCAARLKTPQVLQPEVRMLLLRRQAAHAFSSCHWEFVYSELPAEVRVCMGMGGWGVHVGMGEGRQPGAHILTMLLLPRSA